MLSDVSEEFFNDSYQELEIVLVTLIDMQTFRTALRELESKVSEGDIKQKLINLEPGSYSLAVSYLGKHTKKINKFLKKKSITSITEKGEIYEL